MSSKILQNLLEGFSDNFSVLSDAQYRHPDRGGFRKDAQALNRDMSNVAATVCEKTNEAYVKTDSGKSQQQGS